MLRNEKALSLAATLLVFSTAGQAEDAPASKRSSYPQLQLNPPATDKPLMTPDEQNKLKNELMHARDRQSPAKTKTKKP